MIGDKAFIVLWMVAAVVLASVSELGLFVGWLMVLFYGTIATTYITYHCQYDNHWSDLPGQP